MLAIGDGHGLFEAAKLPATLDGGAADPGVIVAQAGETAAAMSRFVQAVTRHRHYERETDTAKV